MGEVIQFGGHRTRAAGGLTRMQLRVLNYMKAFEASKHVWPTSDDIRIACGIRPRLGPAFIVCNLVRLGALTPEATPPNPHRENER